MSAEKGSLTEQEIIESLLNDEESKSMFDNKIIKSMIGIGSLAVLLGLITVIISSGNQSLWGIVAGSQIMSFGFSLMIFSPVIVRLMQIRNNLKAQTIMMIKSKSKEDKDGSSI